MHRWTINSCRFSAVCLWVSICLGSMGSVYADVGQKLPPKWPWHGVSMGFPEATPKDLERYHHELGINVVRLQVKARQFAMKQNISGDKALDAGLRWVEEMLDVCARLGIEGIVNISQFPLDPSKPGQTTPEFWRNPESRLSVLHTAQRVVEHLSGRGDELAAYDFMSEPVIAMGQTSVIPGPWPVLLQQITNIVNGKDKKRWLLVSPGPWGVVSGYKLFKPPTGERLIWGAHIYTPHAFTLQGEKSLQNGASYPGLIRLRYWNKVVLRNSMQPLVDFNKRNPGPVFVGEFGAVRWADGSEQYLLDLADIFAEQGWGFAYFSATGWHGWNPDYNSEYGNNQQAISQLVGDKSVRWQTLRTIFKVQGVQ